jgi:hypothetical protein
VYDNNEAICSNPIKKKKHIKSAEIKDRIWLSVKLEANKPIET